jgi:HEAT repeat protein
LSAAIDVLNDRQAELASDLNPPAFASFKRNLGPISDQLAEVVRTIAELLNRESAGTQTAMLQVLGDAAELCSTRPERDSRQRLPRGRLMRADIEPEGPQAAERLRKVLRDTLPSFKELMSSAGVEHKLAVLNSLEDLESDLPGIWLILESASRDENRFVRWAALRVMAKQSQAPPEQLLTALRRALHDEDLGVRNAACQTVEQVGRKASALVTDLAKLLTGDDEELQQSALRALYAMGPEAAPAVPQLIYLLKSANPKLRQAVPPLLATIGKPAAAEAVPALRTALSDNDSEVRLRAAEALRRLTE